MELKEFVKNVLVDLTTAVDDAKKESGCNMRFSKTSVDGRGSAVVFDIAVTAEDTKGESGRAGIKVWGVGAGGEIDSEKKHITVSRISFKVDIPRV